MTAIERLLKVFENEVGYLEKKTNASLDHKTENAGYNNYTKYWRDIKPEWQTSAWCAIFVNWCFDEAFGSDMSAKLLKHYPYTYVPTIANLFTRYANPKVGDIVCFYNGSEFYHTGIVTSVSGDYFTTIEGNTSSSASVVANGGGVFKKGYYNSALPGTKFIRPDYSLVEEETKISLTDFEALKSGVEKLMDQVTTLTYENEILKAAIGWKSEDSQQPALYQYNDENLKKYIASDANEVIQKIIDSGMLSVDKNGAFEPLSKTALRLLIIQNR